MQVRITVGSENPAKIEAVKQAFALIFPNEERELCGVDVAAGVSNQPMNDKESIKGARNRAVAALQSIPDADFAVGLEGGLESIAGHWFDCGWIVILSGTGEEGIGSTFRIEVPEKLMKLIRAGKELGEADDIIFQKINSRQSGGNFGLMTNNAVTRVQGYRDGVIAALSRFIHPDLFVKEDAI